MPEKGDKLFSLMAEQLIINYSSWRNTNYFRNINADLGCPLWKLQCDRSHNLHKKSPVSLLQVVRVFLLVFQLSAGHFSPLLLASEKHYHRRKYFNNNIEDPKPHNQSHYPLYVLPNQTHICIIIMISPSTYPMPYKWPRTKRLYAPWGKRANLNLFQVRWWKSSKIKS